jgi:hypothetical protein
MKRVIRCHYRAALQDVFETAKLQEAMKICHKVAREKKAEEKILTCAMFHYQRMVFLYLEYLEDDEWQADVCQTPALWFHVLNPFLADWPEFTRTAKWVCMYPVFYFDLPKDAEQWRRKKNPDERCGRIAILYPDKLFSYVCHHQAIVAEGLLVGDRYQSIALHENILFSYFEKPRDAERVNLKRQEGDSKEIVKWESADPESHFYHFPQANGENFLIIPPFFTVG